MAMDDGLQRPLSGDFSEPTRSQPVGEVDAQRDFDIAGVVRLIWRRKWVTALSILFCVVATAAVVSQITPRYTAAALVMIETRENNVIDFESVLSGLGAEDTALQSEIEIIRSRQLLDRVVQKLRLDEDAEFNPALGPASVWDGAASLLNVFGAAAPDGLRAAFGFGDPEGEVVDALVEAQRTRRAVVDAVASALSVDLLANSFVMAIEFESTNPRKAALIANTIADQYIVDQLEAKFDATQRATVWLNERVGDLKSRVEEAESRVEEYRASQAIVAGQGVELTNQQLAELNSSLIEARAERAEADARFSQVAGLLSGGGEISTAAEVLSSPLIQRLREQEAELRRREAELATRYGDKHPQMINVRAEVADARRAIETEVRKIVEGLRNELQVAQAREGSLQENVSALEQKALGQSRSSVKLRQLQREADATRLIYENFLTRFKETSAQEDLQTADARIISRAEPPNEASTPRTMIALSVAGVLGGFVGLGLTFLLESFNNTFRTAEQFERETGVVVLAHAPLLGPRKSRRQIFDYVWTKPNSALAEAVRNLRTSLLLSNLDTPPKVVVVTSSVPGEGKSTLAMLLALTTSRMGKRTIIVDCDLRRPALSSVFGGDQDHSLLAVVSGRTPLEEAVRFDERETDLHALVSTVSSANSADILSSRRFAELVGRLRQEYDFVVLDTPPTLAVTDARIVAKLSDLALFVAKWDATPREAVKAGVRQMTSMGAPIAGAALMMVDFRRQQSYSADDAYSYYNTTYKEYYRD